MHRVKPTDISNLFARLLRALAELSERIENLHVLSASPWLDRSRVAERMGVPVKALDRIRREDPSFPKPSRPLLKSSRWKASEIDEYMESQRAWRA